jgi:hypothetical protein
MSGSPVYVDGKLIGALASSWTFEREPLFGVTPIRDMLRLLEGPAGSGSGPTAGPTGVELSAPPRDTRFGEFRWDDELVTGPATEGAAWGTGVAGPGGAPTALPVPIACGGLAPAVIEAARSWLAPFGFSAVPGGSGGEDGVADAPLEPGSAVAVDLMRGDLSLSAIGTLTWRDGDRVLLFGHPFFQSGDVRLPLSTARITTLVASNYTSFKLGRRGHEVGMVTQDRHSGVAGTLGARARLLPLTVSIQGGPPDPRHFRFEMVEDRALAPPLVGIATLSSLLESGGSGANQTVGWSLTLHRAGSAPLVLRDVAAGDSPTGDAANGIVGPLGFLFNNPYARLALDSLEVVLRVQPGRAQWTLRGARLLEAGVRPGGRAHVECLIERWRGARVRCVLEVPVPEELPDGRYELWLGGGAELARYEATRFPARYRPTSLDDAWQRLARLRPSDALYAAIFASAPAVTAEGRDYPELPGSAAALLSSGLAAGEITNRTDAAMLGETRLPLEGVTRGQLLLPLNVDSKAP